MNLVLQFREFGILNSINPMPTDAQALYYGLLQVFNTAQWPEEMPVANSTLEHSCQLSRKRISEMRNILIQRGMIVYRSKGGSASPIYKFVFLYGTQTGTQRGTQTGTQIGTQTEHKPQNTDDTPYSSNKQNKTESKAAAFASFIELFNSLTGKKFSGCKKSEKAFEARRKEGRNREDFTKAITNCLADSYHKENSFKHLTPEFITRPDKLEKYLNASSSNTTNTGNGRQQLRKVR